MVAIPTCGLAHHGHRFRRAAQSRDEREVALLDDEARRRRISVGSAPRDTDGAFIPSNPKSINSNWIINQRLDARLTDSWRAWLGEAQAELMEAIREFAARYL